MEKETSQSTMEETAVKSPTMNGSETDMNKKASKKKKNKRFGLILGIVLVIGGGIGIGVYIHSLHHAETENAQVQANISPVIPRVSGYVDRVYVHDNEYVKVGDTLLVLDDRDLALKVQQAEAALAIAQSNLEVAKQGADVGKNQASAASAGVLAADASIEAAKVRQWRAEKDYQRYKNLWEDHSITEQQYEEALAAKQAADRQLELLQKQKDVALRQSKTSSSQSNVSTSQVAVADAHLKQAQAALDEARLNLSYSIITAKVNGQLSEINVEPGQFLQAGQALFDVVSTDEYWVVANFKETELNDMKVGQDADLEVDAYPGHTFHGKVTSFSPATGNAFALLPADNATGNFVKVVQKIPVKISFTDKNDSLIKKLRAGMNVEVDVHIN